MPLKLEQRNKTFGIDKKKLVGLALLIFIMVGLIAGLWLIRQQQKIGKRAAECPSGEYTSSTTCLEAGCDAYVARKETTGYVCCKDGKNVKVTAPLAEGERNCYTNSCTRQLVQGKTLPQCPPPPYLGIGGTNPDCCSRTYQSGGNTYCEYPCNPTGCAATEQNIYKCKSRSPTGGPPPPPPTSRPTPTPTQPPHPSPIPTHPPQKTPTPSACPLPPPVENLQIICPDCK